MYSIGLVREHHSHSYSYLHSHVHIEMMNERISAMDANFMDEIKINRMEIDVGKRETQKPTVFSLSSY